MVKKYLLTILIFILGITACSAGNESASLIGSWNLTSFGPTALTNPGGRQLGSCAHFQPGRNDHRQLWL